MLNNSLSFPSRDEQCIDLVDGQLVLTGNWRADFFWFFWCNGKKLSRAQLETGRARRINGRRSRRKVDGHCFDLSIVDSDGTDFAGSKLAEGRIFWFAILLPDGNSSVIFFPLALLLVDVRLTDMSRTVPPFFAKKLGNFGVLHTGILLLKLGASSLTIIQKCRRRPLWCVLGSFLQSFANTNCLRLEQQLRLLIATIFTESYLSS